MTTQSGTATLGRVRLEEVLEHVCACLEPAAAAREIEIARFDSDASDWDVIADPLRLEQVLLALGANAIAYNRPWGSVVLDVVPLDGLRIRVAVIDTGTGVPIEKQAHVFSAFERASPGERKGPGLTISRRLVETMGGTIGFTSIPGVGSTFWIELPLAR